MEPGIYVHYSGSLVVVIGVAQGDRPRVVYQEAGELKHATLENFTERVNISLDDWVSRYRKVEHADQVPEHF